MVVSDPIIVVSVMASSAGGIRTVSIRCTVALAVGMSWHTTVASPPLIVSESPSTAISSSAPFTVTNDAVQIGRRQLLGETW